MKSQKMNKTFGIISAIVLIFSLSSCFRPMYAENSESMGANIKETFAAISIEASNDRLDQQVSNRLLFKLTGGSAPQSLKYRLSLTTNSSSENALVAGLDLTPKVDTTTIACDFTLSEAGTDKVLLKAKAFARRSHNSSLQRFATIRGQRDAENTIAEAIADQIQMRLASYFEGHAPLATTAP